MIILISALLGALIGAARARRMNGNRLDIAQYAAAHAIAFALVGLLVTVILGRTLA